MPVINKPDFNIFASEAKTGEVEMFPNLLRGWGVTLDQTAGKPPLEWFNYVQKRTDEWLMYLTQRGVSEYDATIDYAKYAVTQYGGKFYVALKQNKGEQPDRSQVSWQSMLHFLETEKKALPLNNFDQHNATNTYYAFGAGASNATPGCPPDSCNSRLTVDVISDGLVTHYEVVENRSDFPRKYIGEYSGAGTLKWTNVVTSKELSASTDSASTTTAASSFAVKKVNDSSLKKSGDTITGPFTLNPADQVPSLFFVNKNAKNAIKTTPDGNFVFYLKGSDGNSKARLYFNGTENLWVYDASNVTMSGGLYAAKYLESQVVSLTSDYPRVDFHLASGAHQIIVDKRTGKFSFFLRNSAGASGERFQYDPSNETIKFQNCKSFVVNGVPAHLTSTLRVSDGLFADKYVESPSVSLVSNEPRISFQTKFGIHQIAADRESGIFRLHLKNGAGVDGVRMQYTPENEILQFQYCKEFVVAGMPANFTSTVHAFGGVYDNNQRVYSRNNPPTSAMKTGSGWWRDEQTGLIMQWGVRAAGGPLHATITFPIAFPNACVNIQQTMALEGGRERYYGAIAISNTQARIVSDSAATYWLAIGF